MKYKLFLVVCINAIAICFPYNIIGCAGGDADPYDYYISFFAKNNTKSEGYTPFYYTNAQFLYDEKEPQSTSDITAAEWIGYTGNSVSKKDVLEFVLKYERKHLSSLYYHIEKNQPLQLPDSILNNGMTSWFMKSRDLEALGYLMYAKQVEPNVVGEWSAWEPIQRDTEKMGKLQKNGLQLYNAAKSDFIKLRYAYQVVRLAHYAGRYNEAITDYEQLVKPNPTKSILQDLSLSLKAGALSRSGNKNEAAYIFSQLFSKNEVMRVSNYMSFDWSVKRFDESNRQAVLSFCKNNEERANVLGLFALGSSDIEVNVLQSIREMAPATPVLEVLTVRELNKLEEKCLTPEINSRKKGALAIREYNTEVNQENTNNEWESAIPHFVEFCQAMAKHKSIINKGLYAVAAAHALLINKDYPAARKQLDEAKKLKLSSELQDQWAITNLLLTINSQPSIDKSFEEKIFPSLQWLQKKAGSDNDYALFYRRIFADILAPRYQQLNTAENVKYLLCIGTAEWIQKNYVKQGWGFWLSSTSILREQLSAEQIQQLISFMSSSKLNAYEKFLVNNNIFDKNDVNDVAGTALLREFRFEEAGKWFAKIPASYYDREPYASYLIANPFADLIEDTHRPTDQDTQKYTKLSFAQKMLQLERDLAKTTDPEKKAKLHYELAKGLYHMSYWGNSWMMSQYSWGGSESLPLDQSDLKPGEKEYYGVFRAREHYYQAYTLSKDPNFKARSLFMVAKCEQKQIPGPVWTPNITYDEYEKAKKEQQRKMLRSPHFSTLAKQYSNTEFFKEAVNTCSYLGDFVRKQK